MWCLTASFCVQDLFGRYVIRGYGSVLIPTVPGKYTRYVRTFAPVSSTYLQGFLGWMTGQLPEFYDSRFVASNEGREVVRVASTGVVRVQFNVMSRGMHSHGYSTGGPPDAPDLDAEGTSVPRVPALHDPSPTPSLAHHHQCARLQSLSRLACPCPVRRRRLHQPRPPLAGLQTLLLKLLRRPLAPVWRVRSPCLLPLPPPLAVGAQA